MTAPHDAKATSTGNRAYAGSGAPTSGSDTDRLVRVARCIEDNPDQTHTLVTLGALVGLSASRLQRLFKGAFGVSPRAYQDGLRMARLRASLKAGEKVTDAIYSAGYGSVSRVYGEADRSLGMPPKRYRVGGRGEKIHYACRVTRLGPLLMAATARGVCFAQFGDSEMELVGRLQAEFPAAQMEPASREAAPHLDDWVQALDAHISEQAPRPELPLDLQGTAFQIQVWKCLQGIREGEVISYSELARRLGRPRAVRAAASACAANRVGVLVPCHRVLRGDGGLGGYRWGLARKQALLAVERNQDRRVLASWHRNAAPWTQAVRNASIASREQVTNQAIVSAIRAVNPLTILDIGCGEGWLTRALAPSGIQVIGVDAVPELVELARASGGGEFRVCKYEDLASASLPLSDAAVCNFSLIGKNSAEAVFAQMARLVKPGGHFLVQTLHPVTACGDLPYEDGWREGSWAGFEGGFKDAPPWYFRTLESWRGLFASTGLELLAMSEPCPQADQAPLSVIFTARVGV